MAEPVEAERVLELLRNINMLKLEVEREEQAVQLAHERLRQRLDERAKASSQLAQLLGHMDITLPRTDGGA